MQPALVLVLATALGLGIAPGPAGALAADEAAPLDRPLGVATPGTLRLLLLDMPLLDARGGPAGLEASWVIANDWAEPTRLSRDGRVVDLQVDEQAEILTLAAAVPWSRLARAGPLADRVVTRLEWRLVQHWGGWTDGPIEGWHHAIGSENFDRSKFPREAVSLHLGEPGGARLFDLEGPRLAPGDLAVRTAIRIAEGERGGRTWAVAVRLDAKLPLGRPSLAGGSGGVDAGAGLTGSAALLPWLTGHGQATLRRVAPFPRGLPLQPRPWQWGLEGSLVATHGGWALLLESRWLSPLFPAGWQVVGVPRQGDALTAATRAQNQVTLGVRWRALSIWGSEDFTLGRRKAVGWDWFYDSNLPDLAVGASVAAPF